MVTTSRISVLEKRVEALEKEVSTLKLRETLRTGLEQSARGQVKYLGSFAGCVFCDESLAQGSNYVCQAHIDDTGSEEYWRLAEVRDSDRLIVERWKAGGCMFCEKPGRDNMLYTHEDCLFAPSFSDSEYFRLQALCDYAKEG